MPAFAAFRGDADVIALDRAGCKSYRDRQGREWLYYRLAAEEADAPVLELAATQAKMHELGLSKSGTQGVSQVCDSEPAFLAVLDDYEPLQFPTFD
jgi:hypothetical protein